MNRRTGAHHRRSIRIKGYDYARPGAYFITVCTRSREFTFGKVANGKMRLDKLGRIVESTWRDLPNHYPNLKLDAFTVMPNHVHGIVILTDTGTGVGAGFKPAPTNAANQQPIRRHGLPEVVRAFKTFSSRRINALRGTRGAPVWQRNYYNRVVRVRRRSIASGNTSPLTHCSGRSTGRTRMRKERTIFTASLTCREKSLYLIRRGDEGYGVQEPRIGEDHHSPS